MSAPLFNRTGMIFWPRHFFSCLLLLCFLGYAIWSFIDIDRRSHSVSDTLINWVFNVVIAAIAYTIIAFLLQVFIKPKQKK